MARKPKEKRRLYYDGIELVRVDVTRFSYRLQERYADAWHVPGGEIATTRELAERARSRGVSLVLNREVGARSVDELLS